MKSKVPKLSSVEYQLLDGCIAWHVRPHRQVFLDGLAVIDAELRFDGLKILEIGATGHSTVSPFLVARGADATATCYLADELPKLENALDSFSGRYGLVREKLHASMADVFALDQKVCFDVVVLKDVLGGVNRQHDMSAFREAVKSCLSVLSPGGSLLIIDKGIALKLTHLMLRKWGSAGRNEWHYFSRDELKQLMSAAQFDVTFTARGVLSFADFGGGSLQKVADLVDEYCLERVFPEATRCVFSMVCRHKSQPSPSGL